jgi:S1-C subfamily serine protease
LAGVGYDWTKTLNAYSDQNESGTEIMSKPTHISHPIYNLEPEVRGALVGDVTPNSPARKAGLQEGDIILDINGTPVNSISELHAGFANGSWNQGEREGIPRRWRENPPADSGGNATETARNEQPENFARSAL